MFGTGVIGPILPYLLLLPLRAASLLAVSLFAELCLKAPSGQQPPKHRDPKHPLLPAPNPASRTPPARFTLFSGAPVGPAADPEASLLGFYLMAK